jgi:hypothetical protein
MFQQNVGHQEGRVTDEMKAAAPHVSAKCPMVQQIMFQQKAKGSFSWFQQKFNGFASWPVLSL